MQVANLKNQGVAQAFVKCWGEAPVQLQRRKTDMVQNEVNPGSRNGDRRSMAPKMPENNDENHQKNPYSELNYIGNNQKG